MSHKGYYSLLQYCPDMSRLEAANIGVLLICAELDFADVLIVSGHDRVRRFFKSENIDYEGLDAAKLAIRNRVRIEKDRLLDLSKLQAFIASRGNEIVLTPTRPVNVVEPEQTLSQLFAELVGGRQRRQTERRFSELDRVLRTPALEGKIKFDLRITVPIVGRHIRAPYAFQNGTLNLIKPERFSANANAATSAAMRLAVEGDLLHRHDTEQGQSATLVVVSDFADTEQSVRGRVVQLLDEYKVRSFELRDIDRLVYEISHSAH